MIKVDPIQRRQFGIIALGLATIFLSVSAAAGVGNAIRRDSVANEVISANKECENRLKLLGVMNVSMGEDKIVANWNSLEGGYTLIGNESAAAMACPGWKMKSFCMGQECSVPGARLEQIGRESCRGKSVSIRVDLGGRRIIKTKKDKTNQKTKNKRR